MRFTLPLLFLVSACQPADADRDAGPVPARDADSARHDDRRPDGDDRRPDGDDDDPPTPDAGLDDPDAAPPETPQAQAFCMSATNATDEPLADGQGARATP